MSAPASTATNNRNNAIEPRGVNLNNDYFKSGTGTPTLVDATDVALGSSICVQPGDSVEVILTSSILTAAGALTCILSLDDETSATPGTRLATHNFDVASGGSNGGALVYKFTNYSIVDRELQTYIDCTGVSTESVGEYQLSVRNYETSSGPRVNSNSLACIP